MSRKSFLTRFFGLGPLKTPRRPLAPAARPQLETLEDRLAPAVTASFKATGVLLVRGEKKLTVSLTGCRMRNYVAAEPITVLNTNALIQAVACVDKNEQLFNRTIASALANP